MGRLLDALRTNSEPVPPAILAIPAILSPEPMPTGADNRRIAIFAAPPLPKNESEPIEETARQTGRLLGMLRAEFLPDSLLARDDAGPDGLAAMDADELRTYALALHRSAIMDAGSVPAEYTQAARCEGCGPVWLWAPCPPVVKACPWCFRRKAGRHFPRPPVKCGECIHFLPDSVNPPGGGGDCGLKLPYRRGEPLRYPFARRQCADYREVSMSPTSNARDSTKEPL